MNSIKLLLTGLACLGLTAHTALAVQQNESAQLFASDGSSGDLFGHAVAADGDVVVVGAFSTDGPGNNAGAVYLFDMTTGQQLTKLQPNDIAAGDRFGSSVAIDGDLIVIGSPWDDDSGSVSGSAYVFETATGAQLTKLVPLDGSSSDAFGSQVALAGSTVLVSAPMDDGAGENEGSVYVFDAITGAQLFKLLPNDPGSHDLFGGSIAISGSRALVGSPGNDIQYFNSGSCYVFDLTTGSQLVRFESSDPGPSHYFGTSVALEGTLALVGADWADGVGGIGSDCGAAYLIDTDPLSHISALSAPNPSFGDQFGVSVALSGSIAVVCADRRDDNGDDSGAAYLVDLANGSTVQQLLPSNGASFDEFGASVAVSGTTAIVGSHWHSGTGSAYLFDIPGGSGESFCSGDGSGAACPCGGNAGTHQGCLNSTGTWGASLTANGMASISNDSFSLSVAGVPGSKPGLVLRGSNQHNGGAGSPVGDGLLCASGQSARSQVQVTSGGSTLFTDFQGSPFGNSSYGAGSHAYYQFWYRDTQNTCSGQGFNFSNGWAVLWTP